jgi:Zn-dependent protease with chaperone function
LLLSAFGVAAGLTILWSLLPRKNDVQINGVLIDLSKESRLAREIEAIATALREPMPTEVYLVGEANAFVTETSGRRIIGVGLPLLQMLTIAQFRAVLAHEFAHYYAGDTRLGPWVYSTRNAMTRIYGNLGRKSDLLSFLRRWRIVSGAYKLLMGGIRQYWNFFMRTTQSISRRQEFRSDELACYIAGSQALIGGLESIGKCHIALNPYWNLVVLPAAMSGFQPKLADTFLCFMQNPRVDKATTEYLAYQKSMTNSSSMDTHPPLIQRIEKAQSYNLPERIPAGLADRPDRAMISLIDHLETLETRLLKKLVPDAAERDLKPMNWETAGMEVYIPTWRRQVADFLPFLSTKKLGDLPLLVLEPQPLSKLVPTRPGMLLNRAQRESVALDVLSDALALCLLDNGWRLISRPGAIYLELGEGKVEPSSIIAAMKSGSLSVVGWRSYRADKGIGDWPLVNQVSVQPIPIQAD